MIWKSNATSQNDSQISFAIEQTKDNQVLMYYG